MTEKFMGVHLEEQSVEDFKDIARKERKKIKDLHKEIIDDYISKHKDGNPVFTLDHFSDANFLATPAYHRPILTWENYLTKCTKSEYTEFYQQLDKLLKLESKIGPTK